jgi:hypothetical protein
MRLEGRAGVKTIMLPDGYHGSTKPFYAEPLERDGSLLKLRCAAQGMEGCIRWVRESDYVLALQEAARQEFRLWRLAWALIVWLRRAIVNKSADLKKLEARVLKATMRRYREHCRLQPDFDPTNHTKATQAMIAACRELHEATRKWIVTATGETVTFNEWWSKRAEGGFNADTPLLRRIAKAAWNAAVVREDPPTGPLGECTLEVRQHLEGKTGVAFIEGWNALRRATRSEPWA